MLGDRRVEAEARRLGSRLDPQGFVERSRAAAKDRRVTIRPAPDTMSRLTIFCPVVQGVAAYASLTRHADSLAGQGDPRTRGQVMADAAVELITGQAHAGDVPVEIHLVMTAETLLGNSRPDDEDEPDGSRGSRDGRDGRDSNSPGAHQPAGRAEPAYLYGFGPIAAGIARDLVFGVRRETPQWIRRLFVRPGGGELIAMESRRRCFTPAQRLFLELADQVCRTPWCEAPIRHIDHVRPAGAGGPTRLGNGQGYCVACNHAKQAPGWHASTGELGSRGSVVLTTPTGHRYRSRPPDPPDPPGTTVLDRSASPLERRLARLIATAA